MIMGVKLDVCSSLLMTILSLLASNFEQAEVPMEGQPHRSLHFELLGSAGMFQSSLTLISDGTNCSSGSIFRFQSTAERPMVVIAPAGIYASRKWPRGPVKSLILEGTT